ncbi:MAG: hypothetical protein RJA70_1935 [Pseudomonadota bacterium]|jgi:hypothetical protein
MSGSKLTPEQLFSEWQAHPTHGDDARWLALAERIDAQVSAQSAARHPPRAHGFSDDNDDSDTWLLQAPLPLEEDEPRLFAVPPMSSGAMVAAAKLAKTSHKVWWLGGASAAAAALVLLLRTPVAPPTELPSTELAPASELGRGAGASHGGRIANLPPAPAALARPAAVTPTETPSNVTPLAKPLLSSESLIRNSRQPSAGAAPLARAGQVSLAPLADRLAPEVAARAAATLSSVEGSPAGTDRIAGPPAETDMVPAAQPTSRRAHPSIEAARAALRPRLEEARQCFSVEDEPARANVVFTSDGKVSRVDLSGPALGTPSEACIRRALEDTRVTPFTDPVFSVGTRIRP